MIIEEVNKFLRQPARTLIYDKGQNLVLLHVLNELGQPVKDTGCPKCLKDAIDEARKQVQKMAKQKKKYKIKNVVFGFEGKRITPETITDAIQRRIEKTRPDLLALAFEEIVIPTDSEK